MSSSNKDTFFGFSKVPLQEKAHLVSKVFSSVANKYDIMNDVMSAGIHRLWKDNFVSLIPVMPDSKILDVAGGTGDIAIRYHKKMQNAGYSSEITICDINAEMIAAGRDKAIDQNILHGLYYVQGDAEKLPFPDNIFDCYTIGFGIRNITNIENALAESYRVLKPGGKFMCLEFSKLESDLMQKFYDLYSFNIIPKMGKCIANNEDAYQYLVESIHQFPDQESFASMIKGVGYKGVHYQNLSFGIAAIHMADKIC